MLDAETVEWFKENGGLRRENGDVFRAKLLSVGGSVDAMDAFRCRAGPGRRHRAAAAPPGPRPAGVTRRAVAAIAGRSTVPGVSALHDYRHLASGKVRELYEVDDELLLMVASDRISAYDHVLPNPIPDKGRVLTAMSVFWFELLADLVPEPRRRGGRPADSR